MAENFVESARALFLSGKPAEAESLLRKSEDPWTLIHLADLILWRAPFDHARVDEACALYELAAKQYPQISKASIERARAMLQAAPDPLVEKLNELFGFSEFRPGQREVIDALFKGRHALAVMPTGGGKSLLYELPSQVFSNATIVISPLISLMKDQEARLHSQGITNALYVNSSLEPEETGRRLAEFRAGRCKLLFVAPERFTLPWFLQMLSEVRVDLVAVDEAHCVSDWGHDFRPDYLRLREALFQVRPKTVLAVTATATPRVRSEIIDKLGLQNPLVHVATFDRPNLFLSVARSSDRIGTLAATIRDTPGSAIVYVNRRADAEEVAGGLRNAGLSAAHYHAALPSEVRSSVQTDWKSGKTRVIVATIAFGMGIDKPDVRGIFHYQYPASLEDYYQQIGRAGRDGQPAKCIVFYDPDDKGFHRWVLEQEFPDRAAITQVFNFVRDGLDQEAILRFGGGAASTMHQAALTVLEQAGAIRRTAPGKFETVPDTPPVARLDLSEVERRRRQSEERLRAIENYLEGRACRRRAILEYFGEHFPSSWSCTGCDRCRTLGTPETKRTPAARQAVLDSIRQLESKRMTLNQMARAILFLGKPIQGLTETDVRDLLHTMVREGIVEVNPQGLWLRMKR